MIHFIFERSYTILLLDYILTLCLHFIWNKKVKNYLHIIKIYFEIIIQWFLLNTDLIFVCNLFLSLANCMVLWQNLFIVVSNLVLSQNCIYIKVTYLYYFVNISDFVKITNSENIFIKKFYIGHNTNVNYSNFISSRRLSCQECESLLIPVCSRDDSKKTYYGQVIGNVYGRQNQTSFNTRDSFNDKLLRPYFL